MSDDESAALRDIPGYEGLYAVDANGVIHSLERSVARGSHMFRVAARALTPFVNKSGYASVGLYRGGRGKTFEVHVLVAAAFHGPRPEGMQIRHLDGVPLHLAPSNLAYGTVSQNRIDSVTHGTHPWASRSTCLRGHELDGRSSRQRYCKTCHRESCRRYREAKR